MARPTDYTEELGRQILTEFAGGKTILQLCASEDMPHRSTVYRWIASDKAELAGFKAEYVIASKAHALALADETLEIADDTSNDTITKTSNNGEHEYEVANTEYIARSRLRVETRFKLMAKRAPELFGEQLQLGGVGGGPIQITDPNNRDTARRIAMIMAMGLMNAKKNEPPMLEHDDAA
jgi:hypothetical protein